jgi:hypothetical protein
MPFVALVARELGAAVDGMDDLTDGFDAREEKMVGNALARVSGVRRVVVCLHRVLAVPGFRRRFEAAGYRDTAWPDAEKRAALATPVAREYPKDLKAEIEETLARSERGENPFQQPSWTARRRAFLAKLP